jgi:hypothetical protein
MVRVPFDAGGVGVVPPQAATVKTTATAVAR